MTERKWLGPKGGWVILGGGAVLWVFTLLFDAFVARSPQVSFNSLAIGGFVLAVALLYTMAYRLRPEEGVTVGRLVFAFVVGGLLATTIAGPINYGFSRLGGGDILHPSTLAYATVGFVEEGAKLLAVALVSYRLSVRTAHVGLFLGGAVGLGFSAFEDASYQLRAWEHPTFGSPFLSQVVVTVVRDVLGPLEHPIMTALLAAALFSVARGARFRITGRVVLAYLAIAVWHSLVDLSSVGASHVPFAFVVELIAPLAIGLVGGTVWLVLSRRIRDRALVSWPFPTPPPAGPEFIPQSHPEGPIG